MHVHLYNMSGLRKLFVRRDTLKKVTFIGSLFPMPATVIDDLLKKRNAVYFSFGTERGCAQVM